MKDTKKGKVGHRQNFRGPLYSPYKCHIEVDSLEFFNCNRMLGGNFPVVSEFELKTKGTKYPIL
jgi:hypothetical protein